MSNTTPHAHSAFGSRAIVYDTLFPLERTKGKRVLIDERLHQRLGDLSDADKKFTTYLTMGILRHWFGLEQLIAKNSRFAYKKLMPEIRLLLKIGLFQLLGMDSIPDYAAVSSTMDLASQLGLSTKSRGIVNAILHAVQRKGAQLPPPEENLPAWFTQRLAAHYDGGQIHQIATSLGRIPILSLRINTLKTTVDAYKAVLTEAQIPFELTDIPEVLHLPDHHGDVRHLPGYEAGWFYIQDSSSALVSVFLAPQPGEQVLEIGAAPGSKTTHMAALMQNQGHIVAVDQSPSRIKRLLSNCERLGVTNVETLVQGGESLELEERRFDRILVDAPCSGTGTLGKHPEILITLQESELSRYSERQLTLLSHALRYLKPEGTLVYSTCSILWEENGHVIAQLLSHYPESLTLLEAVQILPTAHHDGFYLAKLRCIHPCVDDGLNPLG